MQNNRKLLNASMNTGLFKYYMLYTQCKTLDFTSRAASSVYPGNEPVSAPGALHPVSPLTPALCHPLHQAIVPILSQSPYNSLLCSYTKVTFLGLDAPFGRLDQLRTCNHPNPVMLLPSLWPSPASAWLNITRKHLYHTAVTNLIYHLSSERNLVYAWCRSLFWLLSFSFASQSSTQLLNAC